MKRASVTGWQAVERIDVGMVHRLRPTLLCADRWISPTGVEATIVTSGTFRGADPVPRVVSAPAVARDAEMPVGRYLVDPQLRWHTFDDRHYLVSPALGLRLSIRAASGGFRKNLARFRRRPCLAVIEELEAGACPFPAPDAELPAAMTGTFPALVTRWPVPVTAAPEAHLAPAPRPARIVTGPASFLREDHDERFEPVEPVAG